MLPQLRTSSQLMDVLIYLQIVVLVSLRNKDIKEEKKPVFFCLWSVFMVHLLNK